MDNYSDQPTETSTKHDSVRPADGKRTDQKMSDRNVRGEFPRFMFVRRRDIELKAGLLLAGNLILDEAKPRDGEAPPDLMKQEVPAIVQRLTEMAQSALLPDDAMVIGWRGGREPVNAVDIDDDALLAAWAKGRLSIVLRIDPREDADDLRIDGDVFQQFGFIPNENR
jgi:hypothetical protein